MHDVVVSAVAKAVSAATNIFTAISIKRFFIGYYWLRDYTIIGVVVAAGVVTRIVTALRVVAAWRLATTLTAVALAAALRAATLRCTAVGVLVLVLARELLVEAGAQTRTLTHGRCLVDRPLAYSHRALVLLNLNRSHNV